MKAYRREDGTDRVVAFLEGTDVLVAARLTHVEVAAALSRRGRATGIAAVDMMVVLATLDQDISERFEVVELTIPVMAGAVALARTYHLRGADAVQLACLLTRRGALPTDELVLVGSDQELNAAAQAEGFLVIDPARH